MRLFNCEVSINNFKNCLQTGTFLTTGKSQMLYLSIKMRQETSSKLPSSFAVANL